ncbi:MAG: ABC transporter ATP-binding protein [Candidatus Zixiibacteriota bacterium]
MEHERNNDIVLEGIDIHKSFQTGAETLHVLKGVNIGIRRGEIVSVVGASGVGKSTLLHILGALDRPTEGKVRLDSTDVFALNDKKLAHLRNKTVGFVFQFHHLLPEFSALENVMMPRLIAGEDISLIREKAEGFLSEVGLGERIHHKPGELSGGERQRVAVARALVNEPQIVIADEPSGNLDKATGEELHNLISELNQKKGQTFIIATHNQLLAQRAHRIITLVDGKAVAGSSG